MEFHAARKKHNVGTNLLTPETITAFLGQIWSYSGQIRTYDLEKTNIDFGTCV